MSPFFRTIIFTITAPGFWTVLLPYLLLRRAPRPVFAGTAEVSAVCGCALIAAGLTLYLACAFWGFALRGLGTPAPIDPPRKLVVEGPYRVVRNPMYWSVFFVMAGEALLFRSATRCGRRAFWPGRWYLSGPTKNPPCGRNSARNMRSIAEK